MDTPIFDRLKKFLEPAFIARLKRLKRQVTTAKAEGQRALVARQLRRRLGRTKRTEGLVARLDACSPNLLGKVADLIVGTKPKAQLLEAIERLVPKAAAK